MSYIPKQLVLLSSQTASSSASISFTSAITSKYSSYLVTVRGMRSATNNVALYMTASTDNGSTYINSGYQWGFLYASATGFNSGVNNSSDSQWTVDDIVTNTANTSYNCNISLFNFAQSSLYPSFMWDNVRFDGTTVYRNTGGGAFASATNINAIKFAMSSGNIATGTFSLYGVVEP